MRKILFTSLFLCFCLNDFVEAKNLCCCNYKHTAKEFREEFFGKFSLEKQNFVADLWKLERFENEAEIRKAVESKKLVAVPSVGQYHFIDPRLDKKTYFIRPWTLIFIEQFARDFYLQTQSHKKWRKKKIETTGFVRDRKYQKALARRNPNAAREDGNPARQSSHLTGATVDVTTRGLSKEEICWIKEYLFELQNLWLIHVRDEFYNNCFHIMVFPVPTYTGDIK